MASIPTYIIGSGWWCADSEDGVVNPKRHLEGDDFIRDVRFFSIWLECIGRVADPQKIVVVDSNSPVKPAQGLRADTVWIELPFNARHATEPLGKWSGWTRSVLTSAHYALVSEVDYFVYVEQDCLLHGPGIIENCISKMTRGFAFGDGVGTPQPLQQSFFIIRRDKISGFLHNLARISSNDKELPPEWKFLIATSSILTNIYNIGLIKGKFVRRVVRALAKRSLFDSVSVGSGRVRPIPTGDKFYYAQHCTVAELKEAFPESIDPGLVDKLDSQIT